jgi:hypothetical protein
MKQALKTPIEFYLSFKFNYLIKFKIQMFLKNRTRN